MYKNFANKPAPAFIYVTICTRTECFIQPRNSLVESSTIFNEYLLKELYTDQKIVRHIILLYINSSLVQLLKKTFIYFINI